MKSLSLPGIEPDALPVCCQCREDSVIRKDAILIRHFHNSDLRGGNSPVRTPFFSLRIRIANHRNLARQECTLPLKRFRLRKQRLRRQFISLRFLVPIFHGFLLQ